MPSMSAPRRTRTIAPLRGLLPLLRPYRAHVALALLFLLLASMSTLGFPLALRALVDGGLARAGGGPPARAALAERFVLLFGLAVALGVFSAARYYMVSWIGERMSADLRAKVYANVLRLSPDFFEVTRAGEVISRLTADTTLVQTVVGSSLSMGLRNGLVFAGALGMLVATRPRLMLGVIGVIVLVVAPAVFIGRRVRRLSRFSQDRVADAGAIAGEVLGAIPTGQAHGRGPDEARRFATAADAAFQMAVRRNRVRALLTAFVIIALFGALLEGLYQGTVAVMQGHMSAGTLGETVLYIGLAAGASASLAEVFGDLLRAAGAAERLLELLAARPTVREPATPRALPAPQGGSVVDFDAVTFSYASRPDQPALRGFSLHVAAGETVALVGPSGAGKSTVLQLLLRFHDPQLGAVRLDGVALQDASIDAVRSRIGLVPQDTTLFATSALENIRYGRPDADEEQVGEAARAAQADAFLRALPQGYGTELGERGVRLSGGQRQRISIARALLRDPPLLLLDEATSALDAQSERALQEALERARRGRTTLVIAHRLATVQRADRIVVMDQGRVVDSGTHAELMARDGLYAGLVALQFLG